jgi:ketosteroid isomerase-like protein
MTATERLRVAMNSHDVDAFAACFADTYRSEQPAHPARAFVGRDQVRRNWTSVFAGVPDLTADVLVAAAVDGVEMSEWVWSGRHTDGSRFEMRGAMVLGISDGLISWGRLYMEPVEHDGGNIEAMVRQTYRPPS